MTPGEVLIVSQIAKTVFASSSESSDPPPIKPTGDGEGCLAFLLLAIIVGAFVFCCGGCKTPDPVVIQLRAESEPLCGFIKPGFYCCFLPDPPRLAMDCYDFGKKESKEPNSPKKDL